MKILQTFTLSELPTATVKELLETSERHLQYTLDGLSNPLQQALGTLHLEIKRAELEKEIGEYREELKKR